MSGAANWAVLPFQHGCALRREEVEHIFREITAALGLRTDAIQPRIHDLRHTFVVRALIDWQCERADISAHLPVLSTYLGHYSEPAVMPNRVRDGLLCKGSGPCCAA